MSKSDYSKEESLTLVSFDTIGGGKLKKLVDQYMVTAVSEALMQKKFNDVEKGVIKINIEISVEPIDDMSYEIKGKVKKTLPQSSCVSIAVGDELGLYVRKDGEEGSPLQGTLDDLENIEISIGGKTVKTSLNKLKNVAEKEKKRSDNKEKILDYVKKEGGSSLSEIKDMIDTMKEINEDDEESNDIFKIKKVK